MKYLNESFKSNILQQLNKKFNEYNNFYCNYIREDLDYINDNYDFTVDYIEYIKNKFETILYFKFNDLENYNKNIKNIEDIKNAQSELKYYDVKNNIKDSEWNKFSVFLKYKFGALYNNPINELDFEKLTSYREFKKEKYKSSNNFFIIYNKKINLCLFGYNYTLVSGVKFCDGIPVDKENVDEILYQNLISKYLIHNNDVNNISDKDINGFLNVLYTPVKAIYIFRDVKNLFYTTSLNTLITKYNSFVDPEVCDIYVTTKDPVMHNKYNKQQNIRFNYNNFLEKYKIQIDDRKQHYNKLFKLYKFFNKPNTKLGMIMRFNKQNIKTQSIIYNAINNIYQRISYDTDILKQNEEKLKSLYNAIFEDNYFSKIESLCKFYEENGNLNFQKVLTNIEEYKDNYTSLHSNIKYAIRYTYKWLAYIKKLNISEIENNDYIQNNINLLYKECDDISNYFKIVE